MATPTAAKNKNRICEICKTTGDLDKNPITIHHIKPQNIEPDDDPNNLVHLCRICHDHVEAVYAEVMFRLNPTYKAKREQEANKNRAYSNTTYYQKLVDEQSEEKLHEFLKKFLERGYKLFQFNPRGMNDIYVNECKVYDNLCEQMREQLRDFDWKGYYKHAKELVSMTARFRISPSEPEI